MRSLAIADGSFGGGQVAILQELEHGRFRGWDAGKFKEFIRPVGKTIVWEPFVIVAGMPQGRGINASPATDVTVRVYSIVEGQETRIEFAGSESDGDGGFIDGKARPD